MLILKTVSNDKIWGTPRLHDYCGNPDIEKIGSVYSVCGIEGLSSEILYGDDNKDLFTAVKKNPDKFGVPEGFNYPLIISFTGADDLLSIQVHPTDEYAQKRHHKKTGKAESWFFITPPDEGWIYSESKLSDKNQIRNKILSGDYEDVVDKVKVKKNDVAYIGAGTLHALTKGALVYEIQQSTDITYRFYDYDRIDKDGKKRDLHLDDAIKTLNTDNKVDVQELKNNQTAYAREYDIKRTKLENEYTNTEKIAQAVTVIDGNMQIDGNIIKKGMSCIVLPGEKIVIDSPAEEVIIATPNLYFV